MFLTSLSSSSPSSFPLDPIDIKLSKQEAENDEHNDIKGGFDFKGFLNKNKISAGLGLLGVFLLGIGVLSTLILSSKNESAKIEILSASTSPSDQTIMVHIAGAVEKPGLYQLSFSSRVNDALIAAGGLSAEADREWVDAHVNLAQKLTDGVKLYIPYKNEVSNVSEANGIVAGEQMSIFIDDQGKININTASLSELDVLPGIGPVLGQRIIDYRDKNGNFTNVEDLLKVTGISQKAFDKLKEKIAVN